MIWLTILRMEENRLPVNASDQFILRHFGNKIAGLSWHVVTIMVWPEAGQLQNRDSTPPILLMRILPAERTV
jgi:hypothetical protein